MLTHTHIAGAVAACAGLALVTGVSREAAIPLLLIGAAAGTLPDIDSPHSKPAQLLAIVEGAAIGGVLGWYFGPQVITLARQGLSPHLLLAGGTALIGAALGGPGLLALLAVFFLAPVPWQLPLLAALGGFSVAALWQRRKGGRWSLLSTAIQRSGGHRGPTHSLPFVALGAGVWLWASQRYNLPIRVPWWTLPGGILTHLVLDTLTKGGVPWGWPLSRKRISLVPIATGGTIEHLVVLPALFAGAVWAILRLG